MAESSSGLTLAQAQRLVQRYTPGYQVERQLAAGNFGRVYLARDELKEVAIKILPIAFRNAGGNAANAPLANRDWRRLIASTDRLHHPSLVRVRDYFQCSVDDLASPVASYGLIYMDYWPMNLRGCVYALRDQQRLTAVRRLQLLANLAQVLYCLRRDTGLLVTDLKPSNILARDCLDGPMTLTVGDLGALHRQGAAAIPQVHSTRYYWAPELHDPLSNEIDETALVYSLGMLAYLILEEKDIGRGEIDNEFRGIVTSDSAREIWSNQDTPELAGARRIVERCLMADRSARFPDFSAVAEAFDGERRQSRRGGKIAKPDPQITRTWQEPATGMEFVYLPGGRFAMGQSQDEQSGLLAAVGEKNYQSRFARELPCHEVTVDGFWMAKHPVTLAQFRKYVEDALCFTDAEEEGCAYAYVDGRWGEWPGYHWKNPGFAQDDDHPVVCVSWFDARKFSEWLAERSGLAIALPSEAQWEYACRAGSETAFSFGNTIEPQQANFSVAQKSGGKASSAGTTSVGRYPMNSFGLANMHGNVWEWCKDGYDEGFYARPAALQPNPVCEYGGGYRVRRGGSWSYAPEYLRSAYRGRNYPDSSYSDIGFRIVFK